MLKKIISYFLVFGIFLFASLLSIACLAKYHLEEKQIISLFQENDLTFMVQKKDGSLNSLMEDTKAYLKFIGIPDEAITAVINSDVTKKFVGKYTYKILCYYLYQDEKVEITKEDILYLTKNNFGVIEDSLKAHGKTFSQKQQDTILGLIYQYSDEIMNLFPTIKSLFDKINDDSFLINNTISFQMFTDFLRILIHKTTILLFLFFLLLFVVLLFLLWKKRYFIYYIKFSFLLYIVFFLIIEIGMGTVMKEYLMSNWEGANSFFNYFVNQICKSLWIFLFISFIFLILCNIFLKRVALKEKGV